MRIERLGFFEEVDLAMEPTEVPEQLDLEVHVVERPTGSFSFGAGFSSQDGFVATGSLSQTNLFGRGYAVNASVDYGGQDPAFLPEPHRSLLPRLEVQLRGHGLPDERRLRELRAGAARRRAGARPRAHRGQPHARLPALQLREAQARGRHACHGRRTDLSRALLGNRRHQPARPLGGISDTRNDRLAPTRGWNLGLTLDGAGPIGFSKFARLEGRVHLVPRSAALAARALDLRGRNALRLRVSLQHDRRLQRSSGRRPHAMLGSPWTVAVAPLGPCPRSTRTSRCPSPSATSSAAWGSSSCVASGRARWGPGAPILDEYFRGRPLRSNEYIPVLTRRMDRQQDPIVRSTPRIPWRIPTGTSGNFLPTVDPSATVPPTERGPPAPRRTARPATSIA